MADNKNASKPLSFTRNSDSSNEAERKSWKVLIVDDDPAVHSVTTLVLKNLKFQNRKAQFFSTYSRKETEQFLQQHDDIAVILLDVVMEEDDAGLRLVRYIRDDLKNKLVRIILRTGQPGYAPEEKVIVDYDINDYKLKTELTSNKLFIAMIAALRNYNHLHIIDTNKRGLEKIMVATRDIFKVQSMRALSTGILTQLTSILNVCDGAFLGRNRVASGFTASTINGEFYIMSGSGKYEQHENTRMEAVLEGTIRDGCHRAIEQQSTLIKDGMYFGYFKSDRGGETVLFLEGVDEITPLENNLINIFKMNVSVAYDNLSMHKELQEAGKELIFSLAGMIEQRDDNTGNHVYRVAELSKYLAKKYGLGSQEQEQIRVASATHDVGKIGIPDYILKKPGPLSKEEFEIMKTHTEIGRQALISSNREVFKIASTIALQHHEKWDGSGYPQGLSGEETHLYARITGLCDVFDALSSDRIYRPRLSAEKVEEYIMKNRGKHFDPILVDIFFKNISTMWSIKNMLA